MYRLIFDTKPTPPPELVEKDVDRHETLIKDRLHQQYCGDDFKARHRLQAIFSASDYDEAGSIDRKGFDGALRTLNVFPEPEVASSWFHRYTTESDARFDYMLFAKSLYGVTVAPSKDVVCRKALVSVRSLLLQRSNAAMAGLARSFRLMDTNRNQKLSLDELKTGLIRVGADLTAEELAHVAKAFDRDGNGISVTEFLRALRGHLSDRRRQLVQLAFNQLDRDKSGIVEFREIAGIYDASRHPEVLAGRKRVEDVLLEFIRCWDRDGDGRITLLEFIDYYKDISCSIDDDDYFELMIRNAWHLAGGSGWCANTSNLRVLVVHEDDSEEVVCITNDLGLDKDDRAALRSALESQGVTSIKRVELAF